VVSTAWEGSAEMAAPPANAGGGGGGGGGGQSQQQVPTKINYNEPPFEVFRTLPGVDHAARVLQAKANITISGRTAGQGTIVGIDNVDFARVAWFRDDLYPQSPYWYLALMGKAPEIALVSSNLAEKYDLKQWDQIDVTLQEQKVSFLVGAILPYWPAQYPDQSPFIVATLDYVYDEVPMIPYDVWLSMKPGAKTQDIIEPLQKAGIEIASISDAKSELITQSKHPARGGVFGILSLGFLITIVVSLAGYVLFWFFNLSGRIVQIGVLRAMGLSRKQLTGMLLLEQVFTAGLSIGLGIGIGKLASLLFLPFLQTTDNAVGQVPPFRVIFNNGDSVKLYIVVAVMMAIGVALLVSHIRRLKVHQAVKLGEER